MLLRIGIVSLFAVVTAFQVARTAVIAAWAGENPALAAKFWPDHPEIERSIAMAEVGAAAARASEPQANTLQRLDRLAESEPLAPEPFLVRGAMAQRSGDLDRAERLLLHARRLEPRSVAARFLLADLYIRTGRIDEGLIELAAFSRFAPGGTVQLAGAVAQYAMVSGSLAQVKRLIAVYPELEPALLNELSRDTRNTNLILSLVPRAGTSEISGWGQVLLSKLVEEGEYQRAYEVWLRLAGLSSGSGRGLFNSQFQENTAPPPFNWTFVSESDGVAEPNGNGLNVLYFGRGDVVLARQLMLLRPGRYRLESDIASYTGDRGNVVWRVTCLPSERKLSELVLPHDSVGEFEVPSDGCEAQRVELQGIAKEFARKTNFRVKELQLTRSGT